MILIFIWMLNLNVILCPEVSNIFIINNFTEVNRKELHYCRHYTVTLSFNIWDILPTLILIWTLTFHGWLLFKSLNQFCCRINFYPENTTVWPIPPTPLQQYFLHIYLSNHFYSSLLCAVLMPTSDQQLSPSYCHVGVQIPNMKWTAYYNITYSNVNLEYFYISLISSQMLSTIVFGLIISKQMENWHLVRGLL